MSSDPSGTSPSEPQPSHGEPPYGQPYGQAPYGQPAYEQPPFGQGPYGQHPHGQPPYPPQAYPYGQQGYAPAAPGTDGLAIGALVSGILGLSFVPLLASFVAIVLGIMSLARIRTSGQEGRGMAITGIVLGAIGVVLTLLLIVALVVFAVHVDNDVLVHGHVV